MWVHVHITLAYIVNIVFISLFSYIIALKNQKPVQNTGLDSFEMDGPISGCGIPRPVGGTDLLCSSSNPCTQHTHTHTHMCTQHTHTHTG